MLSQKVIYQTFFDFLQQGQKVLFSTALNVIVIQALPRDHYGVFGLVTGYFVFITFLILTPETILIRNYKTSKEDPDQHAQRLSTIYTFSVVRAIGIVLVSLAVAVWVGLTYSSWILFGAMTLYGVYQAILIMSGSIQFVLRMEFLQHLITRTTTILKILQTSAMLLIFLSPSVLTYLVILIASTLLELLVWTRELRVSLPFPLWQNLRTMAAEIKQNLLSYSLWDHLNQSLIKYLYEIDTFFLSLFVTLTTVGNYTVALRIANFSFILPSIIQNSVILALSRLEQTEKEYTTVNIFLRYAIAVAVLQVAAFFAIGKWYIRLHTDEFVDEIFLYSMVIFAGTAILNSIRPLLSFIVTKLNVRKLFFRASIPMAVIVSALYPLGAYIGGGIGIAVANIACYIVWAGLLILFIKRNSAFRFSLLEITSVEREVFHAGVDRLKSFFRLAPRP